MTEHRTTANETSLDVNDYWQLKR